MTAPIAHWDFATTEGTGFRDRQQGRWLEAMHGPAEVEEIPGPWGPRCARIVHGRWLRLARPDLGSLNIHGRSPFTIHAWIQPDSDRLWQFIAGVWNEKAHRQYALFTHGSWRTDPRTYERCPERGKAHAYGSSTGHHTPGHIACFSYATGGTTITPGRWHAVAASWDLTHLRVWVDGRLDAADPGNPFPWEGPIFDGGQDGADFTVAQRNYRIWDGYPATRPPVDEGFSGLLGGLQVYDQALSAEAIARLADGG